MYENLRQLIVSTLEDNKAQDVVVIDTSTFSTIFDFMVVASADNPRHVQALSRYMTLALKKNKFRIVGVEGEREGNWILVDLGLAIIHIMLTEFRDHYALEELWQRKPSS